ncbi:hypothetical protein ACHAQD_003571 [Fusarium lateritium]
MIANLLSRYQTLDPRNTLLLSIFMIAVPPKPLIVMEKRTLGLIIAIIALSVIGGALTIYHCCIKKQPHEGHSPFYPGTPGTPSTPSPRPSLTVEEAKPFESVA